MALPCRPSLVSLFSPSCSTRLCWLNQHGKRTGGYAPPSAKNVSKRGMNSVVMGSRDYRGKTTLGLWLMPVNPTLKTGSMQANGVCRRCRPMPPMDSRWPTIQRLQAKGSPSMATTPPGGYSVAQRNRHAGRFVGLVQSRAKRWKFGERHRLARGPSG